jgi:hypothetical protein
VHGVRSETGLMLVDDPKATLDALCTFGDNEVDWASFKSAYETRIGRGKYDPVDKGTADCHFYTLTIFELLMPVEGMKGKYRLNLASKNLCKMMADEKQREDYQNLLADILLTNPDKGDTFSQFLDFVRETKTRNQICEKFRSEPGRTLIAWCEEADLIAIYDDNVRALSKPHKAVSQEEFLEKMTDNYKEMQRTEILGVTRIYIPIGELRFNTRTMLGLKKSEFDEHLRALLHTEHGRKILLYGAPSDAFENQETFEDDSGKLYIYMRMKV